MTFEEWADRLELAEPASRPKDDSERAAWRCDGPCGQLMYGIARINNWNYPTSATPVGSYIDETYKRVCEVCWAMNSVLSERAYWIALRANDKKNQERLKPGGFYA